MATGAQLWYEQARVFSDGWDQTSVGPAYDTLPWAHCELMVDHVFSKQLVKVTAP